MGRSEDERPRNAIEAFWMWLVSFCCGFRRPRPALERASSWLMLFDKM